jgi:hypothetical protein
MRLSRAALLVLVLVAVGCFKRDAKKDDQKSDKDKGAPVANQGNPKVGPETVPLIKAGMPRAEVEAILGPGTPTSLNEADQFVQGVRGRRDLSALLRADAQAAGIDSMAVWQNGPGRIYVGFGKVAAGDRAGLCFYARVSANDSFYLGGAVAREGVDKAYNDEKLLADPRWKTGDQAKAALVGKWQKGRAGGYEFKDDGTMTDLNEAEAFRPRITYRFRDDRTIELEKTSVFDPNEKRTFTYRVLVDQTMLYLVDMDGARVRTLDGPYRRSK